MASDNGPVLVVSAHAADFVWRAGGAIALSSEQGRHVRIVCLSYGERGESARAWREGRSLEEIKQIRQSEATAAADALNAEIEFFDAGDYPLRLTDQLMDRLVQTYRDLQPSIVLTHPLSDPYNYDHPNAANMAVEARILAQAAGYPATGSPLGAPPVLFFEPHQPEQCGFVPQLLLDITSVYEQKRKAMNCMAAQQHLIDYYSDLAARRGVQLKRNAGPNLGLPSDCYAEAFMRLYPVASQELF